MDVQRNFCPVGNEILERQSHRLPMRNRSEGLTIGLPGAGEIGRPQIDPVFLPVPEYIYLGSAPCAGVYRSAVRTEIEGHLNEAAVVFETYIPAQPDGRSPLDALAGHRRLGDAAHNRIGEQLPAGSDRRNRRFAAEIVDDGGCSLLILAPRWAADENAGE